MKIQEYKVARVFCCEHCLLTLFGNNLSHLLCHKKHMFGEESMAEAFFI